MDEIFLHHLKDLSEKADRSGRFTFTDFLNLDEQNTLQIARRELIRYECFGGAAGCERVIARFGDPDEMGYEAPFPLVCVKISPLQQKFADELSHRDILGAVMNTGVERGCLGDIVLRDNVAYLFALERIAPYLCENLTRVRHTAVSAAVTEDLPEGDLYRTEAVSLNVTSLRADCAVAALYHLYRGAAEKLFSAQKVFINGRLTESGSAQLKENGGYALDDAETAAAFAAQYQNAYFTINEYWSIGQVANLINDNGANAIHMTLTDDAVWHVTGSSLLASLTLEGDARVIVPEGVTLTVNGVVYTDCTLTADSL